MEYVPSKIETKWQKRWSRMGLFKTDLKKNKKFYCLVMFPYPSGARLHIGHWYNFGPTDTYARFKKMQGFNVFEPIGFDAFGLPAENYAIKTGVHPRKSTNENIKNMIKQLKKIGAMYDWSRMINTSLPEYYRWTQWLFLKFFNSGLAYKDEAPANYCPSCKTVLANEQVQEGKCERCDSRVIQKNLKQWFFKITDYAEELLNGLDQLNWPMKTKLMQKNWIGKSSGAVIRFKIEKPGLKMRYIDVFSTRPETIFGATYIVVAPEKWMDYEQKPSSEIKNYIESSLKKNFFERQFNKEKTGVFTKVYALNPVNKAKIPIWLADYVLPDYGTGAIMCVPAHDQRDYQFALKFGLTIKRVIKKNPHADMNLDEVYEGTGVMINSGQWSGIPSERFKKEIIRWLKEKNLGREATMYKMRDWLISRQRYWGAPIPLIFCKYCADKIKAKQAGIQKRYSKGEILNPGWIAPPENELPVLLPKNVDFRPTGHSPLARSKSFIKTKCPKCGHPALRETDTMDTFVCSSWYFLRYLSPDLSDKPWDGKLVKKWLPVDLYVGGAEHATMHLIYARFVTKALFDMGYLPIQEPFSRLFHQGTITYRGAKMSKSRGNVVVPDNFVNRYGSDTFRMYLMFMGPYNEGGDWSDLGIVGIYRFLNRIWNLINSQKNLLKNNSKVRGAKNKIKEGKQWFFLRVQLDKIIKRVTEDIESFKFNTAIAGLMEWFNLAFNNQKALNKEMLEDYLRLLAPFAPHLSEELWSRLGHKDSIFNQPWPKYNPELICESTKKIIIQVNGKVKDILEVDSKTPKEEILKKVYKLEKIKNLILKAKIQKTIYVPDKVVNIVLN